MKSLYEQVKKELSSPKDLPKLIIALEMEHKVENTLDKILSELKLDKSKFFIVDFLEEWIYAIGGFTQDFDDFVEKFRKEHGEKQLAILIKASDMVFEKLRRPYEKTLDLRTFKMCISLIKTRMFDDIRRRYDTTNRKSNEENES